MLHIQTNSAYKTLEGHRTTADYFFWGGGGLFLLNKTTHKALPHVKNMTALITQTLETGLICHFTSTSSNSFESTLL